MSDLAAETKFDWQPFHCDLVPERDAVRVRPVGELDLATSDEVAGALEELRGTGFRRLVLDLSHVSFIDSSGIRMILQARQATALEASTLTVLPGPPAVQRAFTLTGVADLVSASH